jgi:hypothetical protein
MWEKVCSFTLRCSRGQWYQQALIALVGLIVAYVLIVFWQFFLGIILILFGLWLYNHYFH